MIRIRFDGRSFDRFLSARHTGLPCSPRSYADPAARTVEAGDEVAITRHGRVIAVLVGPDTITRRRLGDASEAADHLRVALELARRAPRTSARIDPRRADELVAAVDEDRDPR